MTEEIDLIPYIQFYENMYVLIGKNDLVIESTNIPRRLAALEFLCEKIVFMLKKGLIETMQDNVEKVFVYEKCLSMAENSLQLVKAKIIYIDRTGIEIESKSEKPTPLLKDIFKSDEDFKKCFRALFDVENPVLGPEGNFILGDRIRKQAMSAWFRALRMKDKINVPGNREVSAKIFNNFFGDLGISGKSIETKTGEKHEYYLKEFLIFIN